MPERDVGEGEFFAEIRRLGARLDADYPEANPGSGIVEYYRDRNGVAVGYVRHFTGKILYVLIQN